MASRAYDFGYPSTGSSYRTQSTFAISVSPSSPSRWQEERILDLSVSRGDEVAVPVEAVLGHSLERRVVDVDDPEPLRVTVRPLEVVEQAPDEVPLDRRAVGNRSRNGGDVRLEVRSSL